ncbi:hypothetical protein, partial [Plasmodium yoelii yoelii]
MIYHNCLYKVKRIICIIFILITE